VQVAERKSEKKARPARTRPEKTGNDPKPSGRTVQIPDDLSEEQRAKVDSLTKEYASRIAELQKKLDNILTAEQKEARRAGQKKALAEGLKGVKLRTAADAAAGMTDKQKKQIDDLRKAISELSRERQATLQAILSEQQ